MMRWSMGLRILRRGIPSPEIAELLIDLRVLGVMRKCVWIVDTVLVPGLNLVGDDRCAFQGDAVGQRVDFLACRRVHDQFVSNSTNDFVTGRSVHTNACRTTGNVTSN